jgi:uncharacterized protein (TIGR02271 family)
MQDNSSQPLIDEEQDPAAVILVGKAPMRKSSKEKFRGLTKSDCSFEHIWNGDHSKGTPGLDAGSSIKEAPNFDPEDNISDTEEDEIFNYYGVKGTITQPAVTESAHVTESARNDRAAIRPAPDAEASAAEIALHEEQLKVGKRNVVAGQVRLHKIVRTEEVNIPVELKSEHVVIERIPATEAKGAGATSFNEERIEIPLSREEAVVEKVSQVTGGVRVRKTEEVRQETVHDSVRREDIEEERVDSSEKIPQK